jgi:hypothetical protein
MLGKNLLSFHKKRMPKKSGAPKILHLLSHLSPPHRNKFESYLASPYFIGRVKTDLPALLRALLPFVDQDSWDGWEEAAFEAWQPGEAFNQNEFRKACVLLGKLLLDFAGQEAYMADLSTKSKTCLEGMLNWKMYDFFPSAFKKEMKRNDQVARSLRWYHHQADLLELEVMGSAQSDRRLSHEALPQMADQLDNFYYIRRLKIALAQFSEAQTVDESQLPDLAELETLLGMMEKKLARLPYLVRAFFWCCKAYGEKTEAAEQEMFRLVLKGDQAIAKEDALYLFLVVLNYCTLGYLTTGRVDMSDRYGETYDALIERGLLWQDEEQLGWHVNNVVNFNLQQGRREWVEQFIRQCEDRLNDVQKEQTLLYCKGLLAYAQGNPSAAANFLQELLQLHKDTFYGMNARTNLAKIYFEEKNDLLEPFLEASIKYVRSKEVATPHKEHRLNFFKLLLRVYRCPPQHTERLLKIKAKIMETPSISQRTWLLQQIAV